MTEKANPSINRQIEAYKTAGSIAYGGHGDTGFIVNGANPTQISVQDQGIDHTSLNSFAETSSASSFSVDIDPGEAFVFGSWIVIDTVTTITLSESTAGQTVYVGWNKGGADDVIVGLDSAFSSATGDTDEKIPLWTFDTDGSGVTSVTDERLIGFTIDPTRVMSNSIENSTYRESVNNIGTTSGTVQLDLSANNVFTITLSGDTTFEFANSSTSPAGNSFTLIVNQDDTGGHTITWPTSTEWAGGDPPALSTNANVKHMIGFVSSDGGTSWIGIPSAQEVA